MKFLKRLFAVPDTPIDLPLGDGMSLIERGKTRGGYAFVAHANHEVIGLVALEKARRAGIAETNLRRFG